MSIGDKTPMRYRVKSSVDYLLEDKPGVKDREGAGRVVSCV